MRKLTYLQFKPVISDPDVTDGCGGLIYKPHISSEDSIWFQMDFNAPNPFIAKFRMQVEEERLVGSYLIKVEVLSDLVVNAPKEEIWFEIDILPCFVEQFYIGS